MTASTTNLTLVVPEAFGEQVAKLPADQKTAVLSVASENIAYLRKHHANNKDFISYLDKQYSLFVGSATT